MTINIVTRYAEDISMENGICNFDKLFPNAVGLSAISWEWPGYSRRNYGEKLLKEMYLTINKSVSNNIHLMVQLVPEQPNTAMVNYKKTWGLIKDSGVEIGVFLEKKNFIDNGMSGLVLTGLGSIPTSQHGEFQKMINLEEKLFFSNIAPAFDVDVVTQDSRLTKWLQSIFDREGIIFFLLGFFDDNNAEVVAVGRKSIIDKSL